MKNRDLEQAFLKLKQYCENQNFKGWDPYDGLNSRIFQALPLKRSSFLRLAWIQLFKRSPINFRPLMLVDKGYNPKGLGLFLTGYCNLHKIGDEDYSDKIRFLADKILDLRSEGYSGDCWGYDFDWQARAFFQPKYTPTVVATTFIANALLEAYEITKDETYLSSARSSCEFILKDLNRNYSDNGTFSFSYSPLDQSVVFNASLLGARLLARIYSYTQEEQLKQEACKAVKYAADHQQESGAWAYGLASFHYWIDNFHTGYNLECIYEYQKYCNDEQFDEVLEKGLEYYLSNFFTDAGIAKYYNKKTYPIDIHAPAQLVLTLFKMNRLGENSDLVYRVLAWTVKNMQDKKGYFYYQAKKLFKSRIPYMRWAQAWMFFALSYYLRYYKEQK